MSFEKQPVIDGDEIKFWHGRVCCGGKNYNLNEIHPANKLSTLRTALKRALLKYDAGSIVNLIPAGVCSPSITGILNSAIGEQVEVYGNNSRYVQARIMLNKKSKFYNENVDKSNRSK